MMKRMKGVSAALESSPSPYTTLYEDRRTRLKHQSLMQDYEELCKETEAQKKKLETMKQKKLTLLSEIRFLRQRYKFLMQNQSQNPASEPKYGQKQNLVNVSRTVRKESKERNYIGNDAAVQRPASRFDLNRKGKFYSEREAALQTLGPIFDLSQKQRTYIGKESVLRNSATIPDLNIKERIYSGKEVSVRNNGPIFDLNRISREEEEIQANGEVIIDEPKICLVRGGSDEQHSDMKLSACRSVGNGSSRTGKRKISWQDQVALRV
ncbi:hypothetical protein P3X46_031749 [Hevea brasiliensis]|uniref:Uncharacterized protein n=1 Tax=Hevea brasiliensis TaxID=3981 RepID=A0ABQ9KPH1_HEVBR|nr:uncharacterized protein LOC110640125 [Hevea brasiliensis]KAJ9141180.1 hypothetical protein P3X46_031749 [Hevea brasiliensis]